MYMDVLPDMVESYNRAVHRSIGMPPAEVTRSNQRTVAKRLYGRKGSRKSCKFVPGDRVRLTKAKRTFKKGYLPNWTEELFTIVYVVRDDHGEILEGIFYAEELQKVFKRDDVYKIEIISKKRKKGRRVQYLVKWLGYPDTFNSWIFRSDLQKHTTPT